MFAISFGLHRAALLLAEHFALFLIQSEVNKKKKRKKTVVIWSHPYWFIGYFSLCRDRPRRLSYSLLNSTTYRNDNENNSISLKLFERFAVGGQWIATLPI